MWKDSDSFLLEEIKFKLRHYELTCKEMEMVYRKISILLWILQNNWYFIPQFKWINNIEMWLILWELWFDIYKINSKEFIWFVWRYFQLHKPSFRLYKKLLSLFYGISEEKHSIISTKSKRKIEIKCWEKLLKIIHDWYKNQASFSESRFLENTIVPMIDKMQDNWIGTDSIKWVIGDVYKNNINMFNIRSIFQEI